MRLAPGRGDCAVQAQAIISCVGVFSNFNLSHPIGSSLSCSPSTSCPPSGAKRPPDPHLRCHGQQTPDNDLTAFMAVMHVRACVTSSISLNQSPMESVAMLQDDLSTCNVWVL